nr:helix-turn-helix transcriptional regulator [Paenibacillus donghaensis]
MINTIGTNIKQLRKIHNLNQTDFANKIGVSQGSLSDLESFYHAITLLKQVRSL